MINTEDDIIDVSSREAVMKGKTPRRLLWILGILFILLLLIIAAFIVSGSDADKKSKDTEQKAIAAKAEADPDPKIVDTLEKEQTKAVISAVKGDAISSSVKSELDKLKGNGTRSGSAVSSNMVDQSQRPGVIDPAIEAARRKRELIITAPIFKSSAKISSGSQQNAAEINLLKQYSNLSDAQTQAHMKEEQLNAANPAALMAAMNSVDKNRSPAASELEFNAAMESKKLAAPTGLISKSQNQCLITPGWLIPVANVEAMNSDLPGDIIAVVREDVYDSLTNTCLAIPKGSKILATYNPNIKIGQERFNIAASVLQLPNGKRVPMMGTSSYDQEGAAGVEADVNNHFFKMLGTSFMLGLVSKLSGNDSVSTTTSNGGSTTNTTVLGKIIGDTATTILERNKNITPTLTRAHATRFNFKVTREFYMEPYRD